MKAVPFLVLLPILAIAACSSDTTPPTSVDLTAALDHDPTTLGSVEIDKFNVCKAYRGAIGPAVTVDWSVQRESGVPGASGSVVLSDGECATVYTYLNDGNSNGGAEMQTVTVTEQPVAGYTTSFVRSSQGTAGGTPVQEPEAPGNSASGVLQSGPDKAFLVVFVNTEIPSLPGRMTGGGSAFAGATRVTHGFELHCPPRNPDRLQVNWNGNRFHMTSLTNSRCTDDPNFDEGKPVAGFDTYTGQGIGRLNGVDGYNIRFQFIDDGEPGTSDIARMTITTPDDLTTVLSVANVLDRGNHQAHK